MKKLILLFLISSSIFAQRSLVERRRDLFLMRSLINRIERNSPNTELKGKGITFQSDLRIETIKNKTGDKTEEEKKYTAFVRGCGFIELSQKPEEFLKKVKKGIRIKIRLNGNRNCKVSDWDIF